MSDAQCRYLCCCGCGQRCTCGVTNLPLELHGRRLAPTHPARGVVLCAVDGCALAMGHFCKHQHDMENKMRRFQGDDRIMKPVGS